jgi:hypothetical protein
MKDPFPKGFHLLWGGRANDRFHVFDIDHAKSFGSEVIQKLRTVRAKDL